MHIEKILKGKIPDKFTIYGSESFICARCELSKGRFLAFLNQDGKLWVGANWHLSLRPITDGKVEWYVSDEQRYPMKLQMLEEVISEVEAAIKNQEANKAEMAMPRKPSD